ncbi:MAG: UxaA family hydrolase [Bacteroidetes bacterium]|nr:UxaA family hydrolase [Bacteroidota bacterium]MCL5025407.1 UxaA family hydrolase [Chloroflexota bacterium]
MSFLGYPRPDGSAGIRNEVLVLPPGLVASEICHFVPGTRTLESADSGSGRTANDRETIARVLIGLGRNPNTAACIVHNGSPGADYPELKAEVLVQEIARSGKPVELLDIAKEGGTLDALKMGIKIARAMVVGASRQRRVPCDDGLLALGVKCGISDPTSGIAGNPVVGYVYDKLVAAGGTAMFGETTEIIGAEHIISKRAVSPEVAAQMLDCVAKIEELAKASGQDIRTVNPVPSNIAGGISSLEEKSLGAIHKAGSAPIQGVLQYGERPKGKGLYFVDNWMTMTSIFLGYAASGAQLVMFQLGGGGLPNWTLLEGVPTGVVPLLWVTANPVTYARSEDSIDFFSGTVIAGEETIEQAGERLYRHILDIASGTRTRPETVRFTSPAQMYLREPVF